MRALGRYVARNDRDASQLLSQFIDVNHRKIRRARRRRPTVFTIETRGEVHDLKEIYEDLNRRYFAGRSTRASPGASARSRAPSAAVATRSRWARTASRIA